VTSRPRRQMVGMFIPAALFVASCRGYPRIVHLSGCTSYDGPDTYCEVLSRTQVTKRASGRDSGAHPSGTIDCWVDDHILVVQASFHSFPEEFEWNCHLDGRSITIEYSL